MNIEFAPDVFIPLGQAGADAFDDTRRWVDPNGRRLSDRLWLARQSDRRAIDTILRGAIVSGDDPIQAAKRLEDYLTPAGQKTTTRTPRSGLGNAAARTLARTEVSRAFNQAAIQAGEMNPFVYGMRWLVSGNHPNPDDCDANAKRSSRGFPPGVYRPSEFPSIPQHPNCRCVASPETVDDTAAIVDRLRRDAGRDPLAFPSQQRSGTWQKVTALFHVARQFISGEAA